MGAAPAAVAGEPLTSVSASAPPIAPVEQRERWVVWLVTATVFLSVLNTTMANVALPTIGARFDAGPAQVGWLVTLYSLVFGITTPFYGRLGDRFGLRRMYVLGLTIFVTSSLLAALAPAFWLLVVFRAGQGLGSAAIPSLGIAMLTRTVPSERRGVALGLVGASVGAGQALGPTLGGTLTEFISWRAVFLISCVAVVLIPPARRLMSADVNPDAQPIDWFGGLALGGLIAGLLVAVGNLEGMGPASPVVLGPLAFSGLAFGLLVVRQRAAAFPFIDRLLLANPRYLALCALGFLTMASNVGAFILAPFLLEEVNGLGAALVGLTLLPQAVAVTFLSRPVGRLADRFDTLKLAAIGFSINLTVLVTLAVFAVGWPAYVLAGLFVLFGVGQAFVSSPITVSISRVVPTRATGAGLGLYNMMFFIGSSFGATASTALLAARETAAEPLLPFYRGNPLYSEFGDAYLFSVAATAVALFTIWLARRTRAPVEE